MFGLPINAVDISRSMETQFTLRDSALLPHLAKVVQHISETGINDVVHASNAVKQTTVKAQIKEKALNEPVDVGRQIKIGEKAYSFNSFMMRSGRLKEAGVCFGDEVTERIQHELLALTEEFEVKQMRFWGKILGRFQDYYVMQGVTTKDSSVGKGLQKHGEGANLYTYWVTNSLYFPNWTELPLVTPTQIKVARQIKCLFTGHLQHTFLSYPPFPGQQKHYLKAQLVRMTSALEIVPKGTYKVSDDNPKAIDYEDEVNVPEFAEMSSLESWTHKNQLLLGLGRCSHYVDESVPEDQIEAVTAELAEKDPQSERLKSITEDKVPEALGLGVQNAWIMKIQGGSQVFTKDQAQLGYGVAVFKNIYWPGWTTVGYRKGYVSVYVGNGIKATQPGWSSYDNPSIAEDLEEREECHEPNPKEIPKPAEEVVVDAPIEE